MPKDLTPMFQFADIISAFRMGFRQTNGRAWDEENDRTESALVLKNCQQGRLCALDPPVHVSLRIQLNHPHAHGADCEPGVCCITATVGQSVHTFYSDRYTLHDGHEKIIAYCDVETARLDLAGVVRIEDVGPDFRFGAALVGLKSGASHSFNLGPFQAFHGFSQIFYLCAYSKNKPH
jgi:hypothetical protein